MDFLQYGAVNEELKEFNKNIILIFYPEDIDLLKDMDNGASSEMLHRVVSAANSVRAGCLGIPSVILG